MPFIRTESPQIGDWRKLKVNVTTFEGTFTKGTKVRVTGMSERGYDFEDEHGNKACETGFDIF